MWLDLIALVGGFGFLFCGWWCMSRFYKRIHGVAAKWWAIPFTHGAVMWAKRLPKNWEKNS